MIVSDWNKENIMEAMKYLMITGRMMKYRLVQNWPQGVPPMFIQCSLSSPIAKTQMSLQAELESAEMQDHLHSFSRNSFNFKTLQEALARVILLRESPLRRCASDQASIHLSAAQAQTLMKRAKVNYIPGAAGCGKSYVATELYKLHGAKHCVYICTTESFLKYLEFNGFSGTLIQCDHDLITAIDRGTFQEKTCIIIDDCHNFSCSKTSMEKLFLLLKENRQMSLFVFADNDYQSFDRQRQEDMYNCINDHTSQVLKEPLVYSPLTEVYRNTRKVVSFIQSAVQGFEKSHYKIECTHSDDGDGVECIKAGNIWAKTARNDLVRYIHSMLPYYEPPEIAVLLDNLQASKTIGQYRHLLEEHMPGTTFQSAADFPRRGIIVDSVDSFLGLDASLCIFILPSTSGDVEIMRNLANPQYRVCLQEQPTRLYSWCQKLMLI